ncbi:MAG: hypothetical protein SFW64_07890 [Alphaproteobacteria bacterium]|nr:hypothetical protein [Alphaproteobacteria bacterium]
MENTTPQSVAAPKHFVTKGEEAFDKRTYDDIGYKANVASSIGMVYAAERTATGRNALSKTAAWIAKTGKFNPKSTQYFLTKTMFLTGGFLVMLPMKWMEDKKAEWVHKKNQEIYGDAANDAAIVQSEKEVAEAPKQGWASLFGARAIALAGFYTLMGMLWDNKSSIARMTNKNFKGLDKTALDAMEARDPSAFAKTASEGFYVDKPLVKLSRALGKGWSKLTGNAAALEKVEEMGAKYPGMMKQAGTNEPLSNRDGTATSLFYYAFSELITSKFVAVWVYILSRFTGPFFDPKPKTAAPDIYASEAPQSAPIGHHVPTPARALTADEPSPRVHAVTHAQPLLDAAPALAGQRA